MSGSVSEEVIETFENDQMTRVLLKSEFKAFFSDRGIELPENIFELEIALSELNEEDQAACWRILTSDSKQ